MEYPIVEPAGIFRMVMFGDSFTFGLFVNTFEYYTELLENSLNKTDCPPYTGFEVALRRKVVDAQPQSR